MKKKHTITNDYMGKTQKYCYNESQNEHVEITENETTKDKPVKIQIKKSPEQSGDFYLSVYSAFIYVPIKTGVFVCVSVIIYTKGLSR